MKWFIILLFSVFPAIVIAQVATPYEKHIKVIRSVDAFQEAVNQNPEDELVDIEQYVPGIKLDIRYATANNFTGEQIYTQPKAFVRRPVAEALKNVQESLSKQNLGLLVYDAYRPYAATVKFYEVYHDTTFVASPFSGSRHNRGAAVDVSLINLTTGKELEMPTGYDSFSDTAAPAFSDLPESVKVNRALLIQVMNDNGFTVYPSEWWHFDYQHWEKFELMDLSFEQLEKSK